MLTSLQFAASITAPIFCVMGLGLIFGKTGWISEEFAALGSRLVFHVCLPSLLFTKLVAVDFRHNLPLLLVFYALLATLLTHFCLERYAQRCIKSRPDRGVFVQSGYRGNMGIIGLAFCFSAFGDQAIAPASFYLAVMTSLYNVLAVMTLTRNGTSAVQHSSRQYLTNLITNPLIIAIICGVAVSLSEIQMPGIVLTTGEYFARMALPLALLCAGASIRLHELTGSSVLYQVTVLKLVLVPLGITLGGLLIGLRGVPLGILYLMCSSPTAAASYPMARALGGNHHLAAAIIAVTTLGSLLSTTLGIFLLRQFGFI